MGATIFFGSFSAVVSFLKHNKTFLAFNYGIKIFLKKKYLGNGRDFFAIRFDGDVSHLGRDVLSTSSFSIFSRLIFAEGIGSGS